MENVNRDISQIEMINVEMLYLDDRSCTRCKSTKEILMESIALLNEDIEKEGLVVYVDLIHIDTLEKAIEHHFLSSPTIRVNGKDIQADIQENECTDCGDLCGDDVACRSWIYEGMMYNVPPKELILEAIRHRSENETDNRAYQVPANILTFFRGKELVLKKAGE